MHRTPTLLLAVLAFTGSTPSAHPRDNADPAVPAVDAGDLRRADKHLEAGRFDKARDAYTELLESEDGRVHLGLARALRGLGEWTAAVDHHGKACKARPDDFETRFAFGETLHEKAKADVAAGDYEVAGYAFLDARRMFEKAAAIDPGQASAWFGAAEAERDRGDRDEAIAMLDKTLEVEPGHVDALLMLGGLLFASHSELRSAGETRRAEERLDECRMAYEKVLEVDRRNGWAVNGLAWLARLDGDEERALDEFHRSLTMNPTIDDSYRNLIAGLAGSKDDRKKLIKLLDGVVRAATRYARGDERDRGRAIAHYYRGVAHKKNRDVDSARKDFEEAARKHSDYATAGQYQLASAQFADNRYDEAVATLVQLAGTDFDTLVACFHDEPDGREQAVGYRSLVNRTFQANDLVAARTVARTVAHALHNSADDWNNYAFFCRETGEYEEAYAAYLRAIELNPNDPNLQNDTALILQYHLGRDIEYAKELYEGAIRDGNAVLEDKNADSIAKENARTAVRDATSNLALLNKGLYVGGPADKSARKGKGKGKKRSDG